MTLAQVALLGLALAAGWLGFGAILVAGAVVVGRLRRNRPHVDGDFALPEGFEPDDAFARARKAQAAYLQRHPQPARPTTVTGSDGRPIARGDRVTWRGAAWDVWAVEFDALILTQDGESGQRAPAPECARSD